MDELDQLDIDKLNVLEREYYLKALDQVATSKITLDDWEKYIEHMRQAVESSLVDEPLFIHSDILPFLKRVNPKVVELRARLKNYLIFERFFSRPAQAKAQLELYKKRLNVK